MHSIFNCIFMEMSFFFNPSTSEQSQKIYKIWRIFFAIILKLKQRTTKSRKGKRLVATKKKKCRSCKFVFFFFFFNSKSYTSPKPIYRPKSTETTETSQYTLVSRAVRIRPVSVPVQALAWKIPAGTVWNYLPSFWEWLREWLRQLDKTTFYYLRRATMKKKKTFQGRLSICVWSIVVVLLILVWVIKHTGHERERESINVHITY